MLASPDATFSVVNPECLPRTPARVGRRPQPPQRAFGPIERCHGPTSFRLSLRDLGPAVTRVRRPLECPNCRNQSTTRFQLVKVRVTTFLPKVREFCGADEVSHHQLIRS